MARTTAVEYVNPAACQPCHREIWESYRRTGMGRSFARVTAQNAGEARYFHKASDRHYTVYAREGRFFQRRTERDDAGRESNAVEKEMHWVVGSGNHSRTYLHRRPDGRLAELPLSWYAEANGSWAMSPGYDRPDHEDFRRDISFNCLFCHNGYPAIAPGAGRSGAAPIFPQQLPEGIDCQRCHGPGSAHIAANGSGSILNPARLTPERQLDLCMQCHLETTSFRLPGAIVRYGRAAFSFRPGEPLGDYAVYFDHPPGTAHKDKFEIAHQAYRMRQSACFQKSAGRMVCTTCHDPHSQQSAARYAAACLQCHANAASHGKPEGCVACHMPRRRTEDVVHVTMTDHFIQRRKPARDLTAPLAERGETDATAYRGEVALYYPPAPADQELYLAVAQLRQGANTAHGIPRLRAAIEKHKPPQGEFAFELAEAYRRSNAPDEALPWYEHALRQSPDFPPAMRGMASALSDAGRTAEAADVLNKARASSPHDPALANDLGLVLIGLRRTSEAIPLLRQAVQEDPDFSEAYNNLAGALADQGDLSGAEQAYRSAIAAQPDLAEAHRNLARLLARNSDLAQAEMHYKRAIRARPDYAAAYLDYGTLLARQEKIAQARPMFEAAIRHDTKLARKWRAGALRTFKDSARALRFAGESLAAEAHNALGEMLVLEGNAPRAIESFRRAVEARPDYAAALANLGIALVFARRPAEAKPYLEQAVQRDPAAYECHLHLGAILAKEGNTAGAAASFQKAMQSPDEPIRRQANASLASLTHSSGPK